MLVNRKPDERRCCPRISTRLDVEVVNRAGDSVEATITDLSVGGLTLEGDTLMVKHIEVIDVETGEPYFPVEASISLALSNNNSPTRLEVLCRQVQKRRLSQDAFRIGMVIVEINEAQREQLARYIGSVANS